MDWDDLRIFDAAVRAGSLSRAAGALGLSQPQVTRRLRAFERRLGARLFDRTARGLRPTRAGERLIPLAAEMRAAADAVHRVLPDLADDRLSVVRIAVDEVRGRLLTDHWSDLAARLPDVALEIVSSHAYADHTLRETEIQLRSCLPERASLIVRRLGTMAHAVYGAKAYVAANPAALTDQRFAACAWIGFAPDDLWYPEEQHWLDRHLAGRPALRVNTMTAALDAAAAGAGLAILPAFMGDADPRLTRALAPDPALHAIENLIVHRDLLGEPAVRRTVDALAALYQAARAKLMGEAASGAGVAA